MSMEEVSRLVEQLHRGNIQTLDDKVNLLRHRQEEESSTRRDMFDMLYKQQNQIQQTIIAIQESLLQSTPEPPEDIVYTHTHGEFPVGSMLGTMFSKLHRMSGDLVSPDVRGELYKSVYHDMKMVADNHNRLHDSLREMRRKYER